MPCYLKTLGRPLTVMAYLLNAKITNKIINTNSTTAITAITMFPVASLSPFPEFVDFDTKEKKT
jgi:hypothetical protein